MKRFAPWRHVVRAASLAISISAAACAEGPREITTYEELCSLSRDDFLEFIAEDFRLERPAQSSLTEAAHRCTEFSGDKYDPTFNAEGYSRNVAMKSSKGISFCRQASEEDPDDDRMKYQLMRSIQSKSPRTEEDAEEAFGLLLGLIDTEYSAALALVGLAVLGSKAGRESFEMDEAAGIEFLETAASQGSLAAKRLLGLYLMHTALNQSDHTRGQLLLIRSAESGDDIAQLILAEKLFELSPKAESDFQKFLGWVTRSAEAGNEAAMLILYEIYTDDIHYLGRDDLPNRPNSKLAEKWMLAALRLKSIIAYATLAADFSGSQNSTRQKCSSIVSKFKNDMLEAKGRGRY